MVLCLLLVYLDLDKKTTVQSIVDVETDTNCEYIYAIKETSRGNSIGKIDSNGNLLFEYTISRDGGKDKRNIEQLYIDKKDNLYVLQETVDVTSGNIVEQEIMKLEGELNYLSEFKTLYKATGNNLDSIEDFSVEENVLNVATICAEGRILKFKGVSLNSDGSYITDLNSIPAVFELEKGSKQDEKYIEVTIENNGVYVISQTGEKEYFSVNDDSISVEQNLKNEDMIVSLVEYEGSQAIKIEHSDVTYIVKRLNYDAKTLVNNFGFPVLCVAVGIAIGGLVYMIAKRKNEASKSDGFPRMKLVFSIALIVVLMGGILVAMSANLLEEELKEQQVIIGQTVHHKTINDLETVEFGHIDIAHIGVNDVLMNVQNIVTANDKLQSKHKSITSVYLYEDDVIYNFVTDKGQVGEKTEISYDKEYLQILKETITDEEEKVNFISEKGIDYAVVSSVIEGNFNNVVGVMTTKVSLGNAQGQVADFILNGITILTVVVGLIVLVLVVIFRKIFKPIDILPNVLLSVVQGKVEDKDLKVYETSYTGIWKSLGEVNRIWLQRMYQQTNVTTSYYRFVPRRIQNLLSKESIQDIHFGDSNMIEAYISVASVNNREMVKMKSSNKAFMDFVNKCFDIFDRNIYKNNGTMLSGDFNLAEIRTSYNSADEALSYAVALQEESQEITSDDIDNPNLFVLIHKNNFFYGIAGSDEQAFPFMISKDMDFLSGLKVKFKEIGTKLVISEEVWKEVKYKYATRYIGFVKDESTEKAFKLYEVLNIYSEAERKLYEDQKEKLEKAIELFYKNDFYLARNIFSALLYNCPSDGIARWYLFACDKYFNSEDLESVDYSLFGI